MTHNLWTTWRPYGYRGTDVLLTEVLFGVIFTTSRFATIRAIDEMAFADTAPCGVICQWARPSGMAKALTVRGNIFNGAQWRPCQMSCLRAEQAAVFTLKGPAGLHVSSAVIITHESAE